MTCWPFCRGYSDDPRRRARRGFRSGSRGPSTPRRTVRRRGRTQRRRCRGAGKNRVTSRHLASLRAAHCRLAFQIGVALPREAGSAPARKDGSRLELAIVSAKSNRLLGSIALSSVERLHARAMVTYWVLPEARGRGVASDAVQLLARWALGDLGLKRLEMFIEPENVASQRVAERCNFVREGLLRSRWVAKGRRRDSVVYALLSTQLQ